VHDLRHFPLPPFAIITFWWQIEDAVGNRLITEPQQFEYTDNRFQWEHLSADGLTVHWIEGYGDPVVVAIPYEEGYTSRMMRYIPHEITHLLVYQAVTPTGYKYVPCWLDEGLATANERLPTPEYAMALEEARVAGALLPLEDLCVPFSPNSRTAFLAYAESASVVQFIRERYGAEGIRTLLAAYANGASCAGGVQEALNISLSGLETIWRAHLEPRAPWRAWVEEVGVWVGLWLLSLLVAVPMIGRFRRR